MSERKFVRGIDHFGITVPDLDAASRFLEEAFDARPLFDNWSAWRRGRCW